jgi:hypothetical protein
MALFTSNPTFGLPSRLLRLVKPDSGLPDETWYQFLVRLAQLSAERPIDPVSVGASPFVYTASTIGHIFVAGGTVSAISLERSGVALACPSNTFIPVAANDTVTVTYSVLPTMTFIPSARA